MKNKWRLIKIFIKTIKKIKKFSMDFKEKDVKTVK